MSHAAVKHEQGPEKMAEQSLTLMEGSLSTMDAYDSVHKLITSTQSYLDLRNFSSQERFGRNDGWSQDMLSGIEGSSQDVIALIDEARANGRKVRIVAQIAVEMEQ